MIIMMNKFGLVLTSRQAGREALAAFMPTLAGVGEHEEVIVDFGGVSALSPSWGDEFLTPLADRFGRRLTLKNTGNPSVAMTLEMLGSVSGKKFRTE